MLKIYLPKEILIGDETQGRGFSHQYRDGESRQSEKRGTAPIDLLHIGRNVFQENHRGKRYHAEANGDYRPQQNRFQH